MSASRLVLGGLGLVVGVYGAFLLLYDRLDQVVGVAVWFGAGVLVHDFLLVPLTLLILALTVRLLPASWRSPVGVGFVVLGTLSVVAVPFLGRFGALADNSTLLDRDYSTGYAVLVGVVVAAIAVGALVARVRDRSRRDTPEH